MIRTGVRIWGSSTLLFLKKHPDWNKRKIKARVAAVGNLRARSLPAALNTRLGMGISGFSP
jgi:hypothetical protein